MEHKVIDNFLSKKEFNILYNNIFNIDNEFHWFFYEAKELEKDPTKDLNQYQFCHVFYPSQSRFFYLLQPLIKKLKIKHLLRIKMNLNPYSSLLSKGQFHIDMENCTTAIFYLNTNNGYTLFEKNHKKIKSEKNRVLIFNSNLKHTGTNTTNKKFRGVINLNYVI